MPTTTYRNGDGFFVQSKTAERSQRDLRARVTQLGEQINIVIEALKNGIDRIWDFKNQLNQLEMKEKKQQGKLSEWDMEARKSLQEGIEDIEEALEETGLRELIRNKEEEFKQLSDIFVSAKLSH